MHKLTTALTLAFLSVLTQAAPLPGKYTELIRYVQPAPDQGETNTCLFMASTGAMEILLNQKYNVRRPRKNGRFDLSESFLIHQYNFSDRSDPQEHFIENAVAKFNHGEAVLNRDWPVPLDANGVAEMSVWNLHPLFSTLPRIKIPAVKSELLFARGRKYSTGVLRPEDILTVKKALVERRSPVIINYNDDDYWHVVLIVGYSDRAKGVCYEMEKEDCAERGAFAVRDSDGKKYEFRSYDWFLEKANAAAVVELK